MGSNETWFSRREAEFTPEYSINAYTEKPRLGLGKLNNLKILVFPQSQNKSINLQRYRLHTYLFRITYNLILNLYFLNTTVFE